VEYVGTSYAGFQRQPAKETVQGILERAIGAVTQEEVQVAASGRTDAGAHATEQVIAFSTGSHLSTSTLCKAINAHLPADIAVTSVETTREDFHPRVDASSRVYRYLIWNRPIRSPLWQGRAWHVKQALNVAAMNEAAQYLVGWRNFSSFVPSNRSEDSTRQMVRAECFRDGHLVVVELEASGFMRQMARSIVGTLVQVGTGKVEVLDFPRIVETEDRRVGGETVPSYGLYLTAVHYHRPQSSARSMRSASDELERFARYA
jgi:tRNA pseudouridine38-40 synthase